MKNIVKTVKTLELIWPGYSLASSMCRILDRLEEEIVPYWELYWDGEREEIEKGGVLVNGHSVLNSLVVEYLGREGEDRFRYLGWVNDEKYWLKEIVGVGEKLLPADCFGNPIVSGGRD